MSFVTMTSAQLFKVTRCHSHSWSWEGSFCYNSPQRPDFSPFFRLLRTPLYSVHSMLSLSIMLLTWKGKRPIMLSYLHSKVDFDDKCLSWNPGKAPVLSRLPRWCVLKSSRVARAQFFWESKTVREFINIWVIFIKLTLCIKEFPLLWKFHLEGTSLFVLVARSLRKLYTIASRCELGRKIFSRWELTCLISTFRRLQG